MHPVGDAAGHHPRLADQWNRPVRLTNTGARPTLVISGLERGAPVDHVLRGVTVMVFIG